MAPPYGRVAEEIVLSALERCRGKQVDSLGAPMQEIEARIIPVLRELATANQAALLQLTGKPAPTLEREIERIARQKPKDAWATVCKLHNVLVHVGALTTKSMPNSPRPSGRMNIKEVAKLIGISERTVYRLMTRGVLRQMKVDKPGHIFCSDDNERLLYDD